MRQQGGVPLGHQIFRYVQRASGFLSAKSLRVVLACLLVVETPLQVLADAKSQISAVPSGQIELLKSNLLASAAQYRNFVSEPVIQDFLTAPFNKEWAKIDPELIDEDPFWLSSQSWQPAKRVLAEDEISAETEGADTVISFDSWQQSLKLTGHLKLLGMADDFIFFAKPEEDGGIFFLSEREAQAQALIQEPAPIYFLPLPKSDAPLTAVDEDSEADWMILQSDESEDFTMDLATVRFVKQWQDFVFYFGQAQCLNSPSCRRELGPLPLDLQNGSKRILHLKPSRGTTALHGFIPVINENTGSSFAKNLQQIFLAQAQAFNFRLDERTWDTIYRFGWIAQIFGGLIVMSVVLQTTLLREKIHRIRIAKDLDQYILQYQTEYKEASDEQDAGKAALAKENLQVVLSLKNAWFLSSQTKDEKVRAENFAMVRAATDKFAKIRLGILPRALRPFRTRTYERFRETWDVFAHLITSVGNFSPVTMGNVLEYIGDRYLPDIAALENSWMRKLLNSSFYYSRSVATANAVNGKTFFLGALASGAIDTAFVALQYFAVVPGMAQWASEYLDPTWQFKIQEAFDVNNPVAFSIMLNDTIRTYINYLQTGAQDYAAQSRAIELTVAMRMAEAELRAIGTDPLAPENQPALTKKLEEKINLAMARLGLPDSSQNLFDIQSIYGELNTKLGFGIDSVDGVGSSPLAMRPGLTRPTLDRSIALAKKFFAKDPSEENRQLVQYFEDLRKDLGLLGALFRPKLPEHGRIRSGLTRVYSAKRALSLLSSDLPTEEVAKVLPEHTRAPSEVLRRAQIVFQYSQNTFTLGTEAKVMNHDFSVTENPKWTAKMEKKQRFKPDFYARWQLGRADRAGRRATKQQNIKLGDPNYEPIYREEFRTELARSVGLQFEPETEHVRMAIAEGEQAADRASQTDAIKKMDAGNDKEKYERLKTLARIDSMEFLRAYKTEVVDRQHLPSTHPDQPGFFQSWRRLNFVKKSKFLTNCLRIAEASFEENRFIDLGFSSFLDRRVPAWHDLRAGFIRSLKFLPEKLTSGFLMLTLFWGVPFSWPTVMLMGLLLVTVLGPLQYLNRVFQHVGYKPMHNLGSRALYMFWYSWLTFFGMFPLLLFASDFEAFVTPIQNSMGWFGAAGLVALLFSQSRAKKSNTRTALKIVEPPLPKVKSSFWSWFGFGKKATESNVPFTCQSIFVR